jgi:carotenoid cleavage dioxygenase-like enzyme
VLIVHRFDGEAMVHAIHIAWGQAKSYTNHWIRAKRYLYEKAAGCNLYPRVLNPSTLSSFSQCCNSRDVVGALQSSLYHDSEFNHGHQSEFSSFGSFISFQDTAMKV